ncbi:MAG: xanthine dehydrogenase YagS FAD-binding subunit [Candidatus Sumerlaeota bacterium]|nr:xanthine dehydrogenase YagS FAD-binding subunit [Candidatus Sumerlaeota bacterium]
MKAFDYAIASNESGALAALERGYRPKASGIDLLDLLKERTAAPDSLVSIADIATLKGIREEDGGIAIGALATLEETGAHAGIRKHFHALAEAAAEAATPQIRARATVGGNICQRPRCWYFRSADFNCLKKGGPTCYAVEGENSFHAVFGNGPCHITHPSNIAPALVAFGAEIVTVAPEDGGRTIRAADFFMLPEDGGIMKENVLKKDELVTEIRLPAAVAGQKSGYVELREKQSFDWPLVSCVAAFNGTKWTIVLGHVAPTPWRAKGSESLLGKAAAITPEIAEKAAAASDRGAKPMSQNAWRLKLVRAAVRRALLLADGKEID